MIRTENYTRGTAMLGYVTRDEWARAEREALNRLVDWFALEMKKKLQQKMAEGYGGWDDAKDPKLQEMLCEKLRSHVERGSGQYIDIANLAAMLWNLEAGPAPEKEE